MGKKKKLAASPGPAEGQTTEQNADDQKNADEQKRPHTASRSRPGRRCCWTLLAALPIVIALILSNLRTVVDEYRAWRGYGEVRMYADLPPGVIDQFRVYDANGDGFLDPNEFAALGLRLREEVR